jgi:predicted PurR-regulated permease PerM
LGSLSLNIFSAKEKQILNKVAGEEFRLPFYIRATIFLVGFFVLIAILYIARGIIIPIVFAMIFAIVLHPVVNFFIRLKINRVIAITITLILTFLVIVLIGSLLISEISRLSESLPILFNKFTVLVNQNITDASAYFEINPEKIHAWITKTQQDLVNSSSAAIEHTLVILGSLLVALFLLPVYIFLILYYQPILFEFILRLFGIKHKSKVSEIVSQTKTVIQGYLIGRLIEVLILTMLNFFTLLIIGIDYALILGFIGALFNVIPYIGGIVAMILPMMVALVTKSSPIYALYVFIAYYFIQLVDNHYFVPFVVASKVRINALFSIVVVFAGNALWGIPGMFLSIPILAIVKLVCDNIEPLNPWGFLLGDSMPQLFEKEDDVKREE